MGTCRTFAETPPALIRRTARRGQSVPSLALIREPDRFRPQRAPEKTFASGDGARLLFGSSSYAKMAMDSAAQ
jgi:hypothetical protein